MALFFKKRPRSIYIGRVGVVPRGHLTQQMETLAGEGPLDEELQRHLDSVLELPAAPRPELAEKGDAALDVFLTNHQRGAWAGVSIGDFGLPLVWRPAIRLSARLYDLRTGKTIKTFHSVKRATWREHLSSSLALKAVFIGSEVQDAGRLKALLDEALIELIARVKESM